MGLWFGDIVIWYQCLGAGSALSLERVLTGTETKKSTRTYHKQEYPSNESVGIVRRQGVCLTARLEGLELLRRKSKELEACKQSP